MATLHKSWVFISVIRKNLKVLVSCPQLAMKNKVVSYAL